MRSSVTCLCPIDPGPFIPFPHPVVPARFRRRINRFVAEVEFQGAIIEVHVPNSGRLSKLAILDNPVYLSDRRARHRKTDYDLFLAKVPDQTGHWTLVDSQFPMDVIDEALKGGRLPEFDSLSCVRREAPYKNRRFDYYLRGPSGTDHCWIEVKSVTLGMKRSGGVAVKFPDAPTQRGVHHLKALIELVEGGARAALVFSVCWPGAWGAGIHLDMDPEFAQTLWIAVQTGVEIYAYQLETHPSRGCRLKRRLPVFLETHKAVTAG